jgi:hypothetical protein
MAENCPPQCPNIQACDARIEGIQDRIVDLRKERSILCANLSSTEAVDDNSETYGGNTYFFPSNINVFAQDWTADVDEDIEINSNRLTRAQQAAPAVYAAHETCGVGPVPTALGQYALLRARAKRHGQQLSEPERTAVLAEDPRYLKCGYTAAVEALSNVPEAF